MLTRCRPQHRGAFMLIEAMIASVVLAVAALGVVSLLVAADQQQESLRQNSVAVSLAKQLMEEISAKPLYPPTGTVLPTVLPSTRVQFTTAGQYAGYTDQTTAMKTASGAAVSPGDGELFSRAVTITDQSTAVTPNVPAGDLELVTVTVTTPDKQIISLSKLMARFNWNVSAS